MGPLRQFLGRQPGCRLGRRVIAEPLSELPPEAESKKRYEKADRHLNELYQKVSKQGSQEAQTNWSQDRKQWIRNREVGAKLYADSGPKRTAGQRYCLLMAEKHRGTRISDRRSTEGSTVE
jgi:uncharacterized protein YecT (DUF1311 family)